jgi:hypothetical protein
MKYIKILLLLTLAFSFMGCAKWQNQVAADGGIWGSYAGDYIVRNDSGGRIMDMWILKNVIVQSVESGSGWLFRDDDGNPIHLGGDVKVIRVIKGIDMSKYHEYHAEFETKTYQELYCNKP